MRKAIALGLTTVMLSIQSHALVADKFKCSIEIKDYDTQATIKQAQEFFVARIPLSASPAPDVRMTAGQTLQGLTLRTAKANFGASLNFYYRHATKIDAIGSSTDARQLTCLGLSGDYCEHGSSDEINVCSTSVVACFESTDDPFDPDFGWPPSTVSNGIPSFNESDLVPKTQIIRNDQGIAKGVINLNCRFMGTFQ